MDLLNHDLAHEFPQHRDKMRSLKITSVRFAHLFADYDKINQTVAEAELGGHGICDENLEDLKKQRLKIKDDIYRMLIAN